MSRVGKQVINIPSGVKVSVLENNSVKVSGPKGELESTFNPDLLLNLQENQLKVECASTEPYYRSLHGLTRTLIANMIAGVTTGFSKTLEINGVGYRASVEGKNLNLLLGYSHPVVYPIPAGLKITVDKQIIIRIEGIDKQLVGQVAANIRAFRSPEPYKGKGIKYSDEVIRRKAGKTGA